MSPSYPSNLTPEQWERLADLITPAKLGDRPRSIDMQAVVNAILYILCAGCAWRLKGRQEGRKQDRVKRVDKENPKI